MQKVITPPPGTEKHSLGGLKVNFAPGAHRKGKEMMNIGENKVGWVLLFFIGFSIIFCGAPIGASSPDVKTLEGLNPRFEELKRINLRGSGQFERLGIFYQEVEAPVTFLTGVEENTIFMVEAKYYDEAWPVGWFPWFDQAEGDPTTVMADGDIYTQQIYFSRPDSDVERLPLTFLSYLNRGGIIKLEGPPSLNFFQLQEINPGLEYYEIMDCPFSHDGSMVFFAPPGPGLGFIGEENGSIWGVIYLHPKGSGWMRWFFQEEEDPVFHPELGELYTIDIVLKEPEGRFNPAEWVFQEEEGREMAAVDFVEEGFVCQGLEMDLHWGMLNLEGTMLNQTGEDFSMVIFSIKIFDATGDLIGEGQFPVMPFNDNQTGPIKAVLPLEKEVSLEDLNYRIEVESYMK